MRISQSDRRVAMPSLPVGSLSLPARTSAVVAAPLFWQLLAILLLFTVFTYAGENFLSRANWLNTSRFTSTILVLALAQTLVVITAGIDLSVGSILAVGSTITGLFLAHMIGPDAGEAALILAVVLGIGAGGLMGLVNGLVITRMGVTPFIATLGMLGIGSGVVLLLTGGQSVVVPNVIAPLGSTVFLSWIPIQVAIALTLAFGVHYLLRYTRFGLHTYAIGSDLEASRRMGINIRRHLTVIYVLSGALCGVAGVLVVAQFGVASPNAGGQSALLNAIAATVIGGASLFGGRGNVSGTILGATIVGSTVTGLVLMGVPPYWQTIVIGVVIVLAVYVQRLGESRGVQQSRGVSKESPTPQSLENSHTRSQEGEIQ